MGSFWDLYFFGYDVNDCHPAWDLVNGMASDDEALAHREDSEFYSVWWGLYGPMNGDAFPTVEQTPSGTAADQIVPQNADWFVFSYGRAEKLTPPAESAHLSTHLHTLSAHLVPTLLARSVPTLSARFAKYPRRPRRVASTRGCVRGTPHPTREGRSLLRPKNVRNWRAAPPRGREAENGSRSSPGLANLTQRHRVRRDCSRRNTVPDNRCNEACFRSVRGLRVL